MNQSTNQKPVKVKLKGSWYNNDTMKQYTEIQENCMPHELLKVFVTNREIEIMGWNEPMINNFLRKANPEWTVDDYGHLVSLPMLISDFVNAELITYYAGKYKITTLGKMFLLNNVIKK